MFMKRHSEETIQRMRDSWTDEKRAAAAIRMRQRIAEDPHWCDRLRGHSKGPKSEHTKHLMSLAKIDVKKSEDHRAAMSAAHKLRGEILTYIRTKFDCTFKEACAILKADRDAYYEYYKGGK